MPLLPAADPSVIFQQLEEGAVLFAPATEIYFGLNEVGARIWQSLPPVRRTVEELTTDIAAAYPDVAQETIRADITELLDQLVKEGLAVADGTSGPDAHAGS